MSLVSKKKRRFLRQKIQELANSMGKPFAVAKILMANGTATEL